MSIIIHYSSCHFTNRNFIHVYIICQIYHFCLELTWDINQPEDEELIELWKLIWDGFQDNRLRLFPCDEGNGARCIGELLVFIQWGYWVVGIKLPEDCDITKMTPWTQDTGTDRKIMLTIIKYLSQKWQWKCHSFINTKYF